MKQSRFHEAAVDRIARASNLLASLLLVAVPFAPSSDGTTKAHEDSRCVGRTSL